MLVLTRKTNEQILIGDDIKITLVRIRGNSVRVGIEAPREVRVVRGELEIHDDVEFDQEAGFEQETVFAHPQPPLGRHARKSQPAINGKPELTVTSAETTRESNQIIMGRVRPAGDESRGTRAPLAEFVSAT